jgi:hypothetical protein
VNTDQAFGGLPVPIGGDPGTHCSQSHRRRRTGSPLSIAASPPGLMPLWRVPFAPATLVGSVRRGSRQAPRACPTGLARQGSADSWSVRSQRSDPGPRNRTGVVLSLSVVGALELRIRALARHLQDAIASRSATWRQCPSLSQHWCAANGPSGIARGSLLGESPQQLEQGHAEGLELVGAAETGPALLDGLGRLVRDRWNSLAPWGEEDEL